MNKHGEWRAPKHSTFADSVGLQKRKNNKKCLVNYQPTIALSG